ncbi:MAG: hypothetical protein M3Z23_05085 [Acidobacteriota bacterium]|nr:hypothetical protein [Acidobacteriota bacterium]
MNSTSASAFNASGSVRIRATNVGVTGGASILGTASITPSAVLGIPQSVDPLAYLGQPAVPGSCDNINYNVSGSRTVTIHPGTYCGGINVSGSSTVTLTSERYILKGGGVQLSGSSSFSGTGVSFFNTSGGGYAYAGIHFSGSTTTNLTAPTSGAMSGILFFGDRAGPAGTSNSFSGSSGSKFEGTLYFPTEHLDYSGSTGLAAAYTIIVARTLTFSGSTSLTLNNNHSGLSGGSPLKGAALAE